MFERAGSANTHVQDGTLRKCAQSGQYPFGAIQRIVALVRALLSGQTNPNAALFRTFRERCQRTVRVVIRVRCRVIDAVVGVLEASENKILVIEFHHDAGFVIMLTHIRGNLDLHLKVSRDFLPMKWSIHANEIVHCLSPAICALSGAHNDFGALDGGHL